jgi:uncharacterized protein YgfB (UPF0149 family)
MLDYFDITEMLDQISADATASSMHGFLCGQICTNGFPSEELWQEFMDPQSNDDEAVNAVFYEMQSFIQEIQDSLNASEIEFFPILPDDESPLEQRTNALADWCHGFLNGFGLGADQNTTSISEDSNEVLSDYTKICQVSVDDGSEENEMAFMELSEYVRVGTILIFDEFNTNYATNNESETVH